MAAAEQARSTRGQEEEGHIVGGTKLEESRRKILESDRRVPHKVRAAPVKTEPVVVISSVGGSLQASMPRRMRGHLHL